MFYFNMPGDILRPTEQKGILTSLTEGLSMRFSRITLAGGVVLKNGGSCLRGKQSPQRPPDLDNVYMWLLD